MIRALEAAGLAWLMFNGALLVSMNREDVWQPRHHRSVVARERCAVKLADNQGS